MADDSPYGSADDTARTHSADSSAQEDAFGRLLDTLYFGGLDERDKGDKFERLMRAYLMTDPAWASQFSSVWLWSEYPDRAGRPDTGIDLVAQEQGTGERVAIQCKFYDPERVIARQDIDRFIAASNTQEFSRRILVSTTVKDPSANVARLFSELDPPLTRIDLHTLESAPIDWARFSLSAPDRMLRSDDVKTPMPHQREAIDDVIAGFAESDRGKLIMACGTGKTYTSLQVVEESTPSSGTVLFLVPSIALLNQTLAAWKRDATEDFDALAVCSDVRVGKNVDGDVSTTDLLVPATTDPDALISRLNRLGHGSSGDQSSRASRSGGTAIPGTAGSAANLSRRTVVFATYQSIEVVRAAQQRGFPEFDLVVCDEAHRTTGATLTGKDESAFVRIHDPEYIRAGRRLYMTATPRVFDENVKRKAEEKSVVVASMDDVTRFGPEFHRLGFGEAVERGLLTDYKVLVLAVDESAMNARFQNLLVDEDGQMSIDSVARIVGCWKGLATRGTGGPAEAAGSISSVGGAAEGAGADDRDSALRSGAVRPAAPMQRAVAFARDIKESRRMAEMFDRVSEELSAGDGTRLLLRAQHVDGGMNIGRRTAALQWLEARPDEGECRILTNARCLSEGVDVPDLDAVLFLNPRNSQVDVVQSVGRVMRRAEGKDYGYIILPVGIPAGIPPEQALKDNAKYKVIWSVLNALRSHDDRFEAIVNKIDLNEQRDSMIDVEVVTVDDDGTVVVPDPVQGELLLPGINDWRDALYARIVDKVGDREYWESWSQTIAEVAGRHTQRIAALVEQDLAPEVAAAFDEFVTALRANLNDGIGREDAISMLSQHLITKPVFDALFTGYDFAASNPVSRVMQRMVETLEGNNLTAETAALDGFYASVAKRASGIDNPSGKQRIITELYEHFFTQAFPKQADALGIVYTPVEIVDFILRAVDDLSRRHFGRGLGGEGVHVLDPFTGTGTFIVRLLESGLVDPHDLARTYATELHANEIMLLAYYIAAVNIEATYHGLAGGDYVPFEGIVLADTFQMTEDDDTLDDRMFTGNNARARRQLDAPIQVIVGNPPYSVGQTSANDNNANLAYPHLDARIRDTYAAAVTGQNKNSLYDSYLRAIRWGTDRLGEAGILAYVTNGGYIDANSAAGVRASLAADFDHVYVYNLRGNQRTSGEQSRREGGKVFGSGSRATVAILLAVKDPVHMGPCELHYRDIGDYLSREDKLAIVDKGLLGTVDWQRLTPNAKHEWINQSSDRFEDFAPLGDKKRETGREPILETYSRGLATGRDAWCYNFSEATVVASMNTLIDTYNGDVSAFAPTSRTASERLAEAKAHATYDPARISWNRGTFNDLARRKHYRFNVGQVKPSMYRPFTKQAVYFDRQLVDMIYQLPSMFPELPSVDGSGNYGFYLHGINPGQPFALLATAEIPCLDLFGKAGQFFPRYTYEKADDSGTLGLASGTEEVIDGYRRLDNVSDDALRRYRKAFGDDVTADAIFASIYALLHSEQYRQAFSGDLKRQLPRVPLPATAADFWSFADAGERLFDLHIGYELVEPYALTEERSTDAEDDPGYYRVTKMRHGGSARAKDLSTIVYNANLTLAGIPAEAHEYMLGPRSALDWLIDRYQVKTDKASGIVNDPNDWATDVGDPRYVVDLIKRITTVSIETMRIVRGLPELPL